MDETICRWKVINYDGCKLIGIVFLCLPYSSYFAAVTNHGLGSVDPRSLCSCYEKMGFFISSVSSVSFSEMRCVLSSESPTIAWGPYYRSFL
jgi:hypothetical protein